MESVQPGKHMNSQQIKGGARGSKIVNVALETDIFTSQVVTADAFETNLTWIACTL